MHINATIELFGIAKMTNLVLEDDDLRKPEPGEMCQIRYDHKFWPGKLGFFQFMAGPDSDIAVLQARSPTNLYYSVSLEDLIWKS